MKASRLAEVVRVAHPHPLAGAEYDQYYEPNTHLARGEDAAAQMALYFVNMREDDRFSKVLFTGHRGSGKSTELYRLEQMLTREQPEGAKFRVIRFEITEEANLVDLDFTNLVFAIMNRLFDAAIDDGLSIDESALDNLVYLWRKDEFVEKIHMNKAEAEAGVEATLGWWGIFRAQVRGILRASWETKRVVKAHIEQNLPQLLVATNDLIADIRSQYRSRGLELLMIVDELEKLAIPKARALFLDHGQILTQFDLHLIYTFPIFLRYAHEFEEIANVFDDNYLLSMVMVTGRNGEPHLAGRGALRAIITRRIDGNLIGNEALEYLIINSGGVLRHLFDMLKRAVLVELAREGERIELSSVVSSFRRLRSDFERTIEASHLEALKRVAGGLNLVQDEPLRQMLQALAVIEYNGDRWLGLHPAVADYLRNRGDLPALPS